MAGAGGHRAGASGASSPARTCVHCGVEVGNEFLCWNCNRNTRHFTETTEQEMYDEYRELVLKKEEKVWRANFLFATFAIGACLGLSVLGLTLSWSAFATVLPLFVILLFIRPAIVSRKRLAKVREAIRATERCSA